jgi:glutamyl-tRNA synthetase
MPLLRNADGSKISKRKNPVSINYYKDIGILPHALLNFLATMGWSFGGDREKFTLAEMIEVFSWDRMSLGGPVFNLDKLSHLNELYIHELTETQLVDAVLGWRFNREYLTKLAPLFQKRIKKLSDMISVVDLFFHGGELDYTAVLADMKVPDVTPADTKDGLLAYVEKIEAREGFEPAMLEEVAREWADAQKWKTKHAFMLLRLAVTGRKASPGLFETMSVLGKDIARRRIRSAAETIMKAAEAETKAKAAAASKAK